MKPGRNRHARKDDLRRALGFERRLRGRLRWAASTAALTLLCLGAVSAQAATGGASPIAESGSAPAAGGETAFSPFRVAGASWYGPGLYGSKTACGEVLRSNTLGVAHRDLPCGTTVKFLYHGHALVTQVIDRGPYVKGRAWDLTEAASKALALEGVGKVRYAVAVEYARPGTRP
jgi:peptidoglycan lytic transglycosylase